MLIGNRSVLHKSPGRFLSGTVASIDRSAFNKPGMMRGAHFSLLAGVPNGHLAPSAWVLPRNGGAMSSVNFAGISVSAAGTGVLGMPGEGTASFTISFADAAGQLIVSGSGSAAMSISTNTPLLTASVSGTGSASFTIGATGLLGAEANLTGSASFTISGTLAPYAIGNMVGSTVDTSVLTPDTIAAGVWGANASNFNAAGTMGNKLNTASSGGVDLNALAAAVWAYTVRGLTVASMPATQEGQILDMWQRLGLDPANPQTTTATSIEAGGVQQSIAETPGAVVVTRLP